MKYISSIFSKYGDADEVKCDAATLFEIQDRQGSAILIASIAEHTATFANKFNLSEEERTRLRASLIESLKGSLSECL